MSTKVTGAQQLTKDELGCLMIKAILSAEACFKRDGLFVEFDLANIDSTNKDIITTEVFVDGFKLTCTEWDLNGAYLFYNASWDDVARAMRDTFILEVHTQLQNKTLYVDRHHCVRKA